MKRLLLLLVLAVPVLAQNTTVFQTTKTEGDMTVTGGHYLFRLRDFPSLDHSTVWVRALTTDKSCNMYRMTVKYVYSAAPMVVLTSVIYNPAERRSDYGAIGDDKDEQTSVRITMQLPIDIRVISIAVEKAKLEVAGSISIAEND